VTIEGEHTHADTYNMKTYLIFPALKFSWYISPCEVLSEIMRFYPISVLSELRETFIVTLSSIFVLAAEEERNQRVK